MDNSDLKTLGSYLQGGWRRQLRHEAVLNEEQLSSAEARATLRMATGNKLAAWADVSHAVIWPPDEAAVASHRLSQNNADALLALFAVPGRLFEAVALLPQIGDKAAVSRAIAWLPRTGSFDIQCLLVFQIMSAIPLLMQRSRVFEGSREQVEFEFSLDNCMDDLYDAVSQLAAAERILLWCNLVGFAHRIAQPERTESKEILLAIYGTAARGISDKFDRQLFPTEAGMGKIAGDNYSHGALLPFIAYALDDAGDRNDLLNRFFNLFRLQLQGGGSGLPCDRCPELRYVQARATGLAVSIRVRENGPAHWWLDELESRIAKLSGWVGTRATAVEIRREIAWLVVSLEFAVDLLGGKHGNGHFIATRVCNLVEPLLLEIFWEQDLTDIILDQAIVSLASLGYHRFGRNAIGFAMNLLEVAPDAFVMRKIKDRINGSASASDVFIIDQVISKRENLEREVGYVRSASVLWIK